MNRFIFLAQGTPFDPASLLQDLGPFVAIIVLYSFLLYVQQRINAGRVQELSNRIDERTRFFDEQEMKHRDRVSQLQHELDTEKTKRREDKEDFAQKIFELQLSHNNLRVDYDEAEASRKSLAAQLALKDEYIQKMTTEHETERQRFIVQREVVEEQLKVERETSIKVINSLQNKVLGLEGERDNLRRAIEELRTQVNALQQTVNRQNATLRDTTELKKLVQRRRAQQAQEKPPIVAEDETDDDRKESA